MKFKCDVCKELAKEKEVVITCDESMAGALGFYHEKCWKEKMNKRKQGAGLSY